MGNIKAVTGLTTALLTFTFCQVAGAVGLPSVPNTHQGRFLPQSDTIGGALINNGKADFMLRLRYEDVTDDIPDASPLSDTDKAYGLFSRVAAGWTTGRYHGFYFRVQGEAGIKMGSDKALNLDDDFRVPPPPAINRINEGYGVIPDNEYAEWNEAYVGWRNVGSCTNSPDLCDGNFSVKLGRQEIIYDNHRWVGNILWRNNFQSFDAFRIDATPVKNLNISYSYIDTVRRAFGSDSIFYKFDMDEGHLINASYTFPDIGKLSLYGYMLDFDDNRRTPFEEGTGMAPPFVGATSFDSDTFGARWSGTHQLWERTDILTDFEYANQDPSDDAASNLDDNDYYNIELGVRFGGTRVDGLGLMPIGEPTFQLKVGQEVLEGNGENGLQTPLSTIHAFQGWADKFVAAPGGTVTPNGGIEDTSINLEVLGLFGKWIGKNKINVVYHDYEADKKVNGLSEYGEEWNFLWGKPNLFGMDGLLGLVKYADYSEDCDGPAPANNGLLCVDTEKLWFMLQFTHK